MASSGTRGRPSPAQTQARTALLAFASSHLGPGDGTALVRQLAAHRRIALPAGQPLPSDLIDVVSAHMDEGTAVECLQELRRRHELGLPLVPRWA